MLTGFISVNRQRGFTLIEVLLAMAITAFVAVVAYTGLSTAISAAKVNERQAERLAEIQMTLSLLERDVRHALLRPIIDEYGDEQPPFIGGNTAPFPLELSRRGYENPRDLRRSELERVRYYLQDNQLWRESWSVLDRVNDEESRQQLRLLSDVEDIRLRFLDGESSGARSSPLGGEWVDEWVFAIRIGGHRLPKALELNLAVDGFGEIQRVVEVGAQ